MKKNSGFRRKLAMSLLAASVALPVAGVAAPQVSAAEPAVSEEKKDVMKEMLEKLTPEEKAAIQQKAMTDMLMNPDKPLEQVAEDALRETVDPQKYQEIKKEVEEADITVEDAMKARDEVTNSPVTPPAQPETPEQPETPKQPETPEQSEAPKQPETPAPSTDIPADPEQGTKPTPKFVDLEKAPWAKDAIQTLVAEGILAGVAEDKFAPMDNVTRAQYTRLLIQALKLNQKVSNPPKAPFTDIKQNDWFALDVATAAKLGIVSGVSKTKFDPNAPITREQMAAMTARAMEAAQLIKTTEQKTDTLNQFKDKNRIASWAQKDVAALTEQKLLNGMSGGMFGPKEKANRAQAAVLIHKVYSFAHENE